MIGFPALGVNGGLILGIIMLTEALKKLDKKKRFKKFYIIIPLVLGIGAAFLMTEPLAFKDVSINAIVYAGVSGYFYKSGKLAIGGIKHEKEDDTQDKSWIRKRT